MSPPRRCPRCHVACADCLSRALFFDERSFRISSAAFGGPRCPNWCRNPTLGRQCSCRDHADALLAWRRDEPFAYHQWRRANEASVTNWRFIEQESGNAQGNCPTCARGAC